MKPGTKVVHKMMKGSKGTVVEDKKHGRVVVLWEVFGKKKNFKMYTGCNMLAAA